MQQLCCSFKLLQALQQQLVGAGSSHVQQVRVGLHHGVNFGLVSSLVSGSAHLSAETALLCCAGSEWPNITCCQDANLQQRVCGLLLPGMGLAGQLPALGQSEC